MHLTSCFLINLFVAFDLHIVALDLPYVVLNLLRVSFPVRPGSWNKPFGLLIFITFGFSLCSFPSFHLPSSQKQSQAKIYLECQHLGFFSLVKYESASEIKSLGFDFSSQVWPVVVACACPTWPLQKQMSKTIWGIYLPFHYQSESETKSQNPQIFICNPFCEDGNPCLANGVWRHSPATFSGHHLLDIV